MMNVDMTKVNELIAERDAFMEDYIKETAKRYTIVMCGKYDIKDGKKNGTLTDYVNSIVQNEYGTFGISKNKFYDRVYDKKAVLGVEMIEY